MPTWPSRGTGGIARTAARNTTPGRYQPPDDILAFLDAL